MALFDPLRNGSAALLDVLLPQCCALCDASTGSAAPLCVPCQQSLPAMPLSTCPRCADFSAAGVLCGRCLSDPPSFDGVISPFLYAEPMDRLIQGLKYQHQLHLARWLGKQILAALQARVALAGAFHAVLPLPLHPARMKGRGFNQAMEVARPIAGVLNLPQHGLTVSRCRDTAPQASLPRQARQDNMRGAFECNADYSGKTLLVIDDVLTTGSSAGELARVLKLHGARQVFIGIAARTHHH
jgi:ComF family protein